MTQANKKQRRNSRKAHAAVTPQDRKMFWEAISRKGGLHIRF